MSISNDCLISFLHLLFLLLKAFKLLIDLLFHHGVQVLLLDLQLLNDASEGFFETLDLLIELLSDLLFKLTVEVLADTIVPVDLVDLFQHLLHHTLHLKNYI